MRPSPVHRLGSPALPDTDRRPPRPCCVRRCGPVGSMRCSSGPSADLRYLVGYHALPLERLTLLVVPVDGPGDASWSPSSRRHARRTAARPTHAELVTWSETDDPIALRRRPAARGRHRPRRAPSPLQDRLWTSFTLRSRPRSRTPAGCPGSSVMRDLRLVKTADEIEALREVGAAIDAVHAAGPGPAPTRSDRGRGRSRHRRTHPRRPRRGQLRHRRLRPERRLAAPRDR